MKRSRTLFRSVPSSISFLSPINKVALGNSAIVVAAREEREGANGREEVAGRQSCFSSDKEEKERKSNWKRRRRKRMKRKDGKAFFLSSSLLARSTADEGRQKRLVPNKVSLSLLLSLTTPSKVLFPLFFFFSDVTTTCSHYG